MADELSLEQLASLIDVPIWEYQRRFYERWITGRAEQPTSRGLWQQPYVGGHKVVLSIRDDEWWEPKNFEPLPFDWTVIWDEAVDWRHATRPDWPFDWETTGRLGAVLYRLNRIWPPRGRWETTGYDTSTRFDK